MVVGTVECDDDISVDVTVVTGTTDEEVCSGTVEVAGTTVEVEVDSATTGTGVVVEDGAATTVVVEAFAA